ALLRQRNEPVNEPVNEYVNEYVDVEAV
ncbi:MAG: hypothetical protein QOH21_825, partial [Acidobacteriota bacterium]|nr:hypothetical protein [Acidobacteriota bacterium]